MMEGIRAEERETLCLPWPGLKPQVAIFSTYNEKYAPLAEVARPNWIKYAAKHGYGLRWYTSYHEDPNRPETFGDKGKFRLFYDLRGHVDLVMFLDIDSLFMNMELTVPRMLLWEGDRFAWTYGDDGPLSGLWIARTDDVTERHLRYAYEHAAIENNVRHGRIEPNGISDQDAMTRLMNVPPFVSTFGNCMEAKRVGHCFESNYAPGDWLITFPGMSVAEKLERMKEYVRLAQ
jgi:hypothetical protein